jgi:hypothetical protein
MSELIAYYGVYAAAIAMVAAQDAQDGTMQDNHAKTARNWDQQLAARGLILYPFSLRTTTLIKAAAKPEIDALRRGPPRNLVDEPKNIDDAHDCLCAYLSGCVEWWSWRIREELLASPEFVREGLTDFKTKKARELRDKRLGKRSLSFLHEAIRFRGKANYREALYLGHGRSVEAAVARFSSDMADTLQAFLSMAGAFAFKRLGPALTRGFIDDISRHRSFSLDPGDVWPQLA